MKNSSLRYLLLLFLMLPGCRQVNVNHEFKHLQNQTKDTTGFSIFWDDCDTQHCAISDETITHTLQVGLSRTQAVGIALENNPFLLADFQTLGISKADLVQAGLYTNPQLDSVFRDPRNSCLQNNIEIEATLVLSDLWQVPLRKRVSKDQLKTTSLQILETILQTSAETRIAYDTLLFAHAKLLNAQKTVEETAKLRGRVYYRQQYGFTTELDKNLADVLLGNAEVMNLESQKDIQVARLHLQELLGINPEEKRTIVLTDSLTDPTDLPSQEALLDWAIANHPRMQIASTQISQYRHLLAYEKSRIIPTINFGVGTERSEEPETPTRIGPAFNMQIPIFNYNQGPIAQARYLCNQAEKLYDAEKLSLQKEIKQAYISVNTYQKQKNIYVEKMITANERAISYTIDFNKKMQISMPVIYQTYLGLLQTRKMYNETEFNRLVSWANLELLVGKNLESFIGHTTPS